MRKTLLVTIACFTIILTSCGTSDQLQSDTLGRNSVISSPNTTLNIINSPEAEWRTSEFAAYVLTERDLSSSIRYEDVTLFTEEAPDENQPTGLESCGVEENLGSFAGISMLIQLSDGTQIQQEVREATPEKIDEFLDVTEKIINCTTGEEVFDGKPLDIATEPLGNADRSIQYATNEADGVSKQFLFSRYDDKLIIIVQGTIEQKPEAQELAALAEKISQKQ